MVTVAPEPQRGAATGSERKDPGECSRCLESTKRVVLTMGNKENSDGSSEDAIPVRVVIRVRPLIATETTSGASECVTVDEKTGSVFVNDRTFHFDGVFGTNCSQEYVYTKSVRELLSSSFEGYNTTIFAYGQTGSGKTYTMGTGCENVSGEQRGILPRMITDLFDHLNSEVEKSAAEGYSYEIYASLE